MRTWVKQFTRESGEKWYEHQPECVLKNGDYKILWDSQYRQCYRRSKGPDLVIVDKKNKTCRIVNFTIPGHSRIEAEEIILLISSQLSTFKSSCSRFSNKLSGSDALWIRIVSFTYKWQQEFSVTAFMSLV